MLNRRGLALAAKLAVTLAMLGYLVYRTDSTHVLDRMAGASRPWLALAALQLGLQPLLATWKWWLVLRALGSPLRFERLFEVNYIGVFFSQALPSTIGGDALRIWFAHREGASLRTAVNAVGLDRASMLVGLLVITLIGFPWSAPRLPAELKVAIPALLVLSLVGLAGLSVADLLLARVPSLSQRRSVQALCALAEDSRRVFGHPARGAAQLGLAVLSATNMVVTCWLIGRALRLTLDLGDFLSVMPAVFFVSSIPVTLSGWGTRELMTVKLLATSEDQAFALSVLFALCSLVVALPGAGYYLARRQRGELPAKDEVSA